MKPAPFAYRRPATLAEALETYAANPDAKVLAGGQSLIPLLSMRLATPPMLIDINGIDELRRLDAGGGRVTFGATVRHSRLLGDVDAQRVQPLLGKALRYVAHPTIRNRGTTLGSVVHADASAEMPAVLALLGGTVSVASADGEREIEAADLFVGPLESSLRTGEIAIQAQVPALPAGAGVAFDEVARRHGDYAVCGVAAYVQSDRSGAVASARTSYLSVCDVPTVIDVSEVFADGTLSDQAVQDAAELAAGALEPDGDIHASAEYRGHLARVLTARTLREAYDSSRSRTEASR